MYKVKTKRGIVKKNWVNVFLGMIDRNQKKIDLMYSEHGC